MYCINEYEIKLLFILIYAGLPLLKTKISVNAGCHMTRNYPSVIIDALKEEKDPIVKKQQILFSHCLLKYN